MHIMWFDYQEMSKKKQKLKNILEQLKAHWAEQERAHVGSRIHVCIVLA